MEAGAGERVRVEVEVDGIFTRWTCLHELDCVFTSGLGPTRWTGSPRGGRVSTRWTVSSQGGRVFTKVDCVFTSWTVSSQGGLGLHKVDWVDGEQVV